MMCLRIVPMHASWDAFFARNLVAHHSTSSSTAPAAVFGGALVEAVARPILSNLDLAQQLDGSSFGPGVADLVAPAPLRCL